MPDPPGTAPAGIGVHGEAEGVIASGAGPGRTSLMWYQALHVKDELVAQPFDGCPPGGPCTIHLRLIATASDVPLAWSVSLRNAPPGTTLDFGSATEVVPAGVAGLPIEAVVAIGWALVLGLLAVVLWRRLRCRQSDV